MGFLDPSENRLVNNIKRNVNQLHQTRLPTQFVAVEEMYFPFWRVGRQDAYASWFEKVSVHDGWPHWYATNGIPGIVPSQHPLESRNRAIKICSVSSKHVKTDIVLNDSIPVV